MRPLLAPEDEIILGQFEGTELLDSSDDHAFRGVKEKIAAEVPVQILQPGDDVIITCLGTGSAMPGKYRNGILFNPYSYPHLPFFNSQRSSRPNPRLRKCYTRLR
jgi:hypothetical protein